MGILSGTTCYLAGPAEKCDDPFGWRREIAQFLYDEHGVKSIDPLIKPEWFASELTVSPSAYKNQYKEDNPDGLRDQDRIRTICKRMVAIADWMVVKLSNEPTVGTIEEMRDALDQNKPDVLICPDEQISMWAANLISDDHFYARSHHCQDVGEFKDKVKNIDSMTLEQLVTDEVMATKWLFLTYWYKLEHS